MCDNNSASRWVGFSRLGSSCVTPKCYSTTGTSYLTPVFSNLSEFRTEYFIPLANPAFVRALESYLIFCERHGGSLHGIVRRGSRHGSSRHGAKSYNRHSSALSLRTKSHPRQDRPSRVLGINNLGREAPATQNVTMSVSGAVQGTAAERVMSVANDPASPIVEGSGAAPVVVGDAQEIMPTSGSKLDGAQGEHAEILGEGMSAGLTGGSEGEGGSTPGAETSLDGTKSPPSVDLEGAGHGVTWESRHSLEKQASPVRPPTTPAVAVVIAGKGHTLVAELPSEAKPADSEAQDVRADSAVESALAVEATRSENGLVSPTNQAGAAEAAAIGHDRVSNSASVGIGVKVAPMTPMGEKKAPAEESAPSEERGRAGSPIGFSSLELHREQQVRNVRTVLCAWSLVGGRG